MYNDFLNKRIQNKFYKELEATFTTVRDNGDPSGDPPAESPKPAAETAPPADPPNQDPKEKPIDPVEHARLREQAQKAVDELENMKKIATMTKEDRDNLDKRIKSLNNELLTEKQRLSQQQKEAEQEFTAKLEAAKQEASLFESLYKTSSIQRSLTDAAVRHEAVNPIQVVNMLDRHTEMVPVEVNGQPTGQFEPKTTVYVEENGKQVPVQMTPEEAVKDMASKEEFFNFFKPNLKAGAGRLNNGASSGSSMTRAEAAKLPAHEYRAWKDANPDK
jgi:hypothetical protein